MNGHKFLKRSLLLCFFIGSSVGFGQSSETHRFEADMSGGGLRIPGPYRTGYFFRQQLTGYVTPRVGIALGVGWANSANLDPLGISNPSDATNPDPYGQPDPSKIRAFYQRTEQMTDLSVVLLPVVTRRHQVKLQVGLSAYRQRETRVDTLIYPETRLSYYEIVPQQTNTLRLAPVVGAGYDFRLSNRWSIGLNGTAYFTNRNTESNARPTTTFGLRGAYRFGLRADSLGFEPVRWNEATWGIRAAGTVVTDNDRSNGLYRLRFNAGLWAEVPLSLTWAMRGELNYAQRGYRAREIRRVNSTAVSGFGNTSYLEVPLLFRHEVAYRWHIYGGPYLAFYLDGYSESDGKRNPPTKAHTLSGLMLGTSYTFSDRLAADLRYQRDLIALSSTPYSHAYHSIQLGLNYSIKRKP